MGNRAVITFTNHATSPCIYLHWNGGRASVEGFLKAAQQIELLPTNFNHESEFLDKFAEMIAHRFFKCRVGMTVYREKYGQADTDNWDNGVYVIDQKLEIIGRIYRRNSEETDFAKSESICKSIVEWTSEQEVAA
jgi:hypothetical protein